MSGLADGTSAPPFAPGATLRLRPAPSVGPGGSSSVTVQSTAATSSWRVFVIGAVAVLAVAVGVVAGWFLLNARSAVAGSAAHYVPAGAPFFLQLRVEPSAQQDADLRELLGRFPPIEGIDLSRPLHEQLVARLDAALADEAVDVRWETDVAPWFDGQLAVAVTEIRVEAMTSPGDDAGTMETPGVVIMLGVTHRAAAEAAIGRLLAAAGPEVGQLAEETHEGTAIYSSDRPEAGAYALTDDQLLLAENADPLRDALSTRAGAAATLADGDEIARLTAKLPFDWLAYGVYDFTELMAAAFRQGSAADPAMAEAFGRLMESQPLRAAFAVSVTGDRILADAVSQPPSGPFAVENAERGLAAQIPADALYYTEAGNIGRMLTAVIGPMKEAIAAEPEASEQLQTFETALGADVEELVDWIGDGAVVAGWNGSAPYLGALLVPTDADAAERRLGQLASFAALAAMDGTSGISVEETTVAGASLTTIRWSDPNGAAAAPFGAPSSVVVEYTVDDDRAIVGVGEGFVRAVLELDPPDSLAGVPRFAGLMDELGGTPSAGMAWWDLAGTVDVVEGALGPTLDALNGDEGVNLLSWLEPLDRVGGVSRLEDGLLVQRTVILFE